MDVKGALRLARNRLVPSSKYRTLNGAKVEDCYMSLIETFRANDQNPIASQRRRSNPEPALGGGVAFT
jgi:hypothetical protein